MDQPPLNENRIFEKLKEMEDKFDKKFDRLVELFQNFSSKQEDEEVRAENKDITYTLQLEDEISELDNFDAILELLNQKANAHGYSFKKGPIKKYKEKPATSKMIVCKYFDRNKNRTEQKNQKPPTDRILIKNIDCKASYRFNIKADSSVSLIKANENHNHGPFFGQKIKLTPQMKAEISRFNNDSYVSEVKDHMEATFGPLFDYWCIYNEFRRQFPRFGVNDCANFVQSLEKNDCLYRKDGEMDGESLYKLLFLTPKNA